MIRQRFKLPDYASQFVRQFSALAYETLQKGGWSVGAAGWLCDLPSCEQGTGHAQAREELSRDLTLLLLQHAVLLWLVVRAS
jgi:hypothetical protein